MPGSGKDLPARIADRLVALGPVRPRAMFGGHGVFLDGVMFGLIVRDQLYFKVGDANRGEYAKARAKPFSYIRGSHRVEMSYMTVPQKVLADSAVLADWAERALDVARASRAKKRR
jgi:DNA transformation protein